MKQKSASELRELAADLEAELAKLQRLQHDFLMVRDEITRDPARAQLFYENLALKLHNFYTGCERVLQMIATELNGALPTGFDWHKRLLERFSVEREGRPAILSISTAHHLQEYLAFRHIVRNLYGFELDIARLERLVANYSAVSQAFDTDVRGFVGWLRQLAMQMENGDDSFGS